MNRVRQDTKSSKDPRESHGLLKAIPKRNLRYLLELSKTPQGELAQYMRVSRQTVNGWLSGKQRMSNEQVIEASLILGVSPAYILDLSEKPEPEPINWSEVESLSYSNNRRSLESAILFHERSHPIAPPPDVDVKEFTKRMVEARDFIMRNRTILITRGLHHDILLGPKSPLVEFCTPNPSEDVQRLLGIRWPEVLLPLTDIEETGTVAMIYTPMETVRYKLDDMMKAILSLPGDYRSVRTLAVDATRMLINKCNTNEADAFLLNMWANCREYPDFVALIVG